MAKIIEKKIVDGILKPGEKLSPEHELASRYNISRMTVRKALQELAKANMIYTEKGKGTFVSKPRLENTVFELKDFHDEIKKMGMEPRTKLLGVEIIKADKNLAKKLNLEINTRLVYFRLLISAEGEPLLYENKYIVYSKKMPILESELKDPSLTNLATQHGNYFPTMSKRILNAAVANSKEAEILEIKKNSPVFVVEQYLYDNEKKPIGWGKSVCRGDRFKFTSYIGWTMDSILE